ncbi:CAP domain-containing protein [Sphaerimonospora cavernae]|uniref:CAP domain-containing protein n=1 Tax=Sphaerimonospora cavernae TaxID=1740611 RepID=A0ABV6U3S0_9ACTN
MNRALGAALCLGSLTVISLPVGAAQATTEHLGCRVAAAKPYVTESGKISAAGYRIGCTGPAKVRVRLWKAVTGPDRAVKSGAKVTESGRLTLTVRCANGVFYTTVTDFRGNTSRSRATRVNCASTPPNENGGASTSSGSTGSGSTGGTQNGGTTNGGSTGSGPAGSGPTTGPGDVGTDLENEVVRLTNVERAKVGCGPLTHDAKLHTAAYGHSADMSAKNYFSHTSQDGSSFADRIRATGYSYTAIAENIAKGYQTPEAVVQGWMNSSGHRTNMLNCNYTDIGVGYAKTGGPYWTQDFGKH